MLNRENKTAITRKGMVSNRLNKFSIRKYTVGTASILVGTTLIFGLGNQEAKAAESTNKELNEATTSASDNQSSDKVDMQQLNQEDNTKNDNQKEMVSSQGNETTSNGNKSIEKKVYNLPLEIKLKFQLPNQMSKLHQNLRMKI